MASSPIRTTTATGNGRRRKRSDKLNLDWLGNQFLLIGLGKELLETGAAARAVVQRELVHIHPDEPVGVGTIQSAPERLRVLDRRGAVVQRVRDAVMQHLRHLAH